MTARAIVRTLAISLLLLACDCGGAPPTGLAAYGDGYEVTPSDSWTLPGLRFYRVIQLGVQDHSSVQIVAVDASGTVISGADLFMRFHDLPPEALAERACSTLIDGCTPLAAADPSAAMWLDGDASRVEAPHVVDGHLVFDIIEGDMAPRAVRITVDLANGNILARDPLRDLAAAPPGPTLPAVALPATMTLTMGVPDPTAPHFVSATLDTTGSPMTISGCVSTVAGACAASVLIRLDADATAELGSLYRDVLAIPRCEPEATVAGDLPYELSWPGALREYRGSMPGEDAQIAARSSGACRADARLARWIGRYVRAESRARSELPHPISIVVDATDGSGPRFVNATLDLDGTSRITGCTANVRGVCHATHDVELDAVQSARARALVEDLRAEPCHVPFPAGAPLSLAVGRDYDGRCAADAALAWWAAGIVDPTAMGAND
jgi:hypothetical protein